MDWDQIYSRLSTDDNDPLAWGALQKRVEAWARAALWTQPRHLVDDAVVDTCAAIAVGLQAARGPATFAGFAYGHFLNARRRLLRCGRQPLVRLDDIDVAAPLVHEGPDAEALSSLRRALAALPAREQTAVKLRYFDDLPAASIAAELGVTHGNARRIVFNGLRRLRAELRDQHRLDDVSDALMFTQSFAVAAVSRAR
jgi:RNA polymerase sigma factor (sigma-70 family)